MKQKKKGEKRERGKRGRNENKYVKKKKNTEEGNQGKLDAANKKRRRNSIGRLDDGIPPSPFRSASTKWIYGGFGEGRISEDTKAGEWWTIGNARNSH